jgi:hypothetical protein
MDNIVTFLPPSKLRLVDAAEAALAAGQLLYQNGRALVAASRKPGPSWHRVGVIRRPA